eukprot:scaffold86531_cov31-Tisochrysis_lutea.AAC.1
MATAGGLLLLPPLLLTSLTPSAYALNETVVSGGEAGVRPKKFLAPSAKPNSAGGGHHRASNASHASLKKLSSASTRPGSVRLRADAAMSFGKPTSQEAGSSGALFILILLCCLCFCCYRRLRRARELRAARHAELTDDMEEALERAAAETAAQKS